MSLFLPDGRDFLLMLVCFVICRALPRDFGLTSVPLLMFARKAEDRPGVCLRRALPGVFGLIVVPLSICVGARRALPRDFGLIVLPL